MYLLQCQLKCDANGWHSISFVLFFTVLDQGPRPTAGTSDSAQSVSSWESGANFELNDADEVVLNMLLTQPSMDVLLDSSSWLETDGFLEYLNMNPDLSSD